MKLDTIFAKNVELFAQTNPVEAYRLQTVDCTGFDFCETRQGELNLRGPLGGRIIDWYTPEGALLEAATWAKIVPLDTIDVLFVYGIPR